MVALYRDGAFHCDIIAPLKAEQRAWTHLEQDAGQVIIQRDTIAGLLLQKLPRTLIARHRGRSRIYQVSFLVSVSWIVAWPECGRRSSRVGGVFLASAAGYE